MATTINADTVTGGAIITGDTTGVLGLQAAGNTLVTLNGDLVSITAPLTSDDSATISGSLTASGLTYPTADGAARKAVTTDGSGTLSFGGYASLNPIVISGNTTAVAGNAYYLDSAGITLTLPASPSSGDVVGISEIAGDTTSVIARNGSKIMSLDSDMTIDTAYAKTTLTYTGASVGWALT